MNPDSLNNQLPAPIENNDENKLAIPTNQIGVPVGTSHTTPNQVVPSGLDSTQSSFSLNPMTAEDDDLIEYEQLNGNELTKVYSDTFKDMKNRQNFMDKYPDYLEGLKRGKQRYQKIDEHRGDIDTLREILSRNINVLEWYDNI